MDQFHRKESHYHFQLHGSVLFGPDTEGLGILPRFGSRELARRSWEDTTRELLTRSGASRPILPMVSGYRKSDSTIYEPLGTYFGLFRRSTMVCPLWIIIGYGGSDEHVNGCLRGAMIQATDVGHVSAFQHAVIIDYANLKRPRLLDLDPHDPIGHQLAKGSALDIPCAGA
jgi:hypothetical protein